MPQWLTRWESLSCACPKWPASNRNAGRLRLATVAGFASEYPAGLNRNLHEWTGTPQGKEIPMSKIKQGECSP
jgi:hypothetical protein